MTKLSCIYEKYLANIYEKRSRNYVYDIMHDYLVITSYLSDRYYMIQFQFNSFIFSQKPCKWYRRYNYVQTVWMSNAAWILVFVKNIRSGS